MASCPATLALPWVESRPRMTSPAIQTLKIGSVLYKELFFAMIDQFKTTGGDQTPTAWRNDRDGTVVSKSVLTMTTVRSVIPKFSELLCRGNHIDERPSTLRLKMFELMSATTIGSFSLGLDSRHFRNALQQVGIAFAQCTFPQRGAYFMPAIILRLQSSPSRSVLEVSSDDPFHSRLVLHHFL